MPMQTLIGGRLVEPAFWPAWHKLAGAVARAIRPLLSETPDDGAD